MVDEQTQNVLLDAVVIRNNLELPCIRARAGTRFSHLLSPGRSSQVDRAFLPIVGFPAGDAPGEFLPGHSWKLFGLEDQLFAAYHPSPRPRAVRPLYDVATQCAHVDIPQHRNLVTVERAARFPPRASYEEICENARATSDSMYGHVTSSSSDSRPRCRCTDKSGTRFAQYN